MPTFSDGPLLRVVNHVKLHSYAVEAALERLVERLHLLRVGVRRVRVKLLQHAPYGVLDELALVNGVDIEAVYRHLGYLQLTQRAVLGEVDAHLGG